jgi:hypothetical protein
VVLVQGGRLRQLMTEVPAAAVAKVGLLVQALRVKATTVATAAVICQEAAAVLLRRDRLALGQAQAVKVATVNFQLLLVRPVLTTLEERAVRLMEPARQGVLAAGQMARAAAKAQVTPEVQIWAAVAAGRAVLDRPIQQEVMAVLEL